MIFIYLVSWVALIVQIIFITVSIAAGLYYLAELVEEYTQIAKKVIIWISVGVLGIYICLALFENMSMSVIICGICSQVLHLLILKNFPMVSPTSIPFLAAIVLFLVNHYFTVVFFSANYYNFSEVMGFFTVCLWLVPFVLFISLSANDNVLPMFSHEGSNLLGDGNDALGNYLSKKQKKYGLLPLLHRLQETILPRNKKMF